TAPHSSSTPPPTSLLTVSPGPSVPGPPDFPPPRLVHRCLPTLQPSLASASPASHRSTAPRWRLIPPPSLLLANSPISPTFSAVPRRSTRASFRPLPRTLRRPSTAPISVAAALTCRP